MLSTGRPSTQVWWLSDGQPGRMPADSVTRAMAYAAAHDDVLPISEAWRLGLTRWDIRCLRRTNELNLRSALTIPPVRDPVRAAARATQLLVPEAVISHETAPRLHGLAGLNFWNPHELVHATLLPAATRWQRAGVRLHFLNFLPEDITDLDGLRVMTVHRALLDCARQLERTQFVSIVDNALNKRLLTLADVAVVANELRNHPAAGWLRLCRLGAESPSETRVRLTLVDADLSPDHLQHDVYAYDGHHVARLDIAFTANGRKVGLEVDSGWHDLPKALYRDRERLNELRGEGWDVRQVTAYDASRRPGYIVQQVRQALG